MLGGDELERGEDVVEIRADPENEAYREGRTNEDAADVAPDGAEGQKERSEHRAVGVGDHAEGEAEEVDFSPHGLETDRHGNQRQAPEDDTEARLADELLLVGVFDAVASVDEGERGLGEGGEGGVEAGDGGGKGSGEDQAGEAGGQDGGDPDGKNRVGVLGELGGFGGGGRVLEVVNKKSSAHEEHEPGDEKRNAAGDDGF